MNKEKWIQAALLSADSMDRAEAPDILARVEARIGGRQVTMTISRGGMWRIAASVAFLIALNVTTLISYKPAQERHSRHNESIMGLAGSDANMNDISTLFFGTEGMSNE